MSSVIFRLMKAEHGVEKLKPTFCSKIPRVGEFVTVEGEVDLNVETPYVGTVPTRVEMSGFVRGINHKIGRTTVGSRGISKHIITVWLGRQLIS